MKLGKTEIFKEDIINMKIYPSSNQKDKNEKFSNDIYPKFINFNSLNNSKYNILLNIIQKKKQNLNNLLKVFTQFNENFNERIGILSNNINKQSKELLNKNKQEFQSFQNLIDTLISLEDERDVKELKKISQYEYLNLQNYKYQKILYYINKSKNEILINLGCDEIIEKEIYKRKRNLSVNKFNRNFENEKNEYNVLNEYNVNCNFNKSKHNPSDFYKSLNFKENRRNKSNDKNQLNNNHLNFLLNEKQFNEKNKLNLFRLMTDDQSIKDEEISIYLNKECKKVEDAVNKYYQNLYGTENLTLTLSYPNFNNLSIVQNFSFKSNISILFEKAIFGYPFASNVHLFTHFNKEILMDNKNKIKCIGSLKLENNTVIFVNRKK